MFAFTKVTYISQTHKNRLKGGFYNVDINTKWRKNFEYRGIG